jgi:hypothetical protein
VNVSKAQELLAEAAVEKKRLDRHLLVAAALREVLAHEPIVVGGTAEELYTAAEYHETDLDLVGWLSNEEIRVLGDLGFKKWGRHWFHEPSKVAVEFPEAHLAGDPSRVSRRKLRGGEVAIIGVDDLYLDRVRQATAYRDEGSSEFRSAVAVGVSAYDRIDWRYVSRHIRETRESDAALGKLMSQLDSKVRRKVRKAISPGPRDRITSA